MCNIRVMTFNIRGSFYERDGVNVWDNRAMLNVKTIKRYVPDVIGFQELQIGNLKTYQAHLAEYLYILGPKSNNKEPHNYNAIFWYPSRFELINSGGFWLSKTSNRYSAAWETRHIRAANWIKLRCTDSGLTFLLLNTHLDNISEQARVEGSKLILQKISRLQANTIPAILVGDFNCNPESPAYHIFQEGGFVDTYLAAGNEDSEDANTIHAFEGKRYSELDMHLNFCRIDWILIQGFQIKSCLIVHDQEPPLYPSDHYPVLSDLILSD